MRLHPPRAGSTFAIILVALVVVVACGWYWWKQHHVDPVTYRTVTVTRGNITQAVTATGTLNPVINVQVGSQISGIIQKLFVDFNSPVKANQVVAQIDPSIYQAVVTQAEGDLASAKASLELAQVNARRSQQLRAQNAAPQSTVDQDQATLHQAEATVTIKEGALERAKVDLEHCTIYSPVDGIVISRSVDVGQTVAASLQAPVIFTIANDLAKMQIDSNVAEADVGNIEVGQSVDFTVDAFPFRTFHGKVSQVRNAATTVQNVVTYDTVISVKNDDLKLKPGMTANASIIIAQHEDVLQLANAALRFRMPDAGGKSNAVLLVSGHAYGGGGGKPGGKPHGDGRMERTVYVLRGDKPEPVQIKTGIGDGIYTEVTEGLKEGDQVIIGMSGGSAAKNPRVVNPFGPPHFHH